MGDSSLFFRLDPRNGRIFPCSLGSRAKKNERRSKDEPWEKKGTNTDLPKGTRIVRTDPDLLRQLSRPGLWLRCFARPSERLAVTSHGPGLRFNDINKIIVRQQLRTEYRISGRRARCGSLLLTFERLIKSGVGRICCILVSDTFQWPLFPGCLSTCWTCQTQRTANKASCLQLMRFLQLGTTSSFLPSSLEELGKCLSIWDQRQCGDSQSKRLLMPTLEVLFGEQLLARVQSLGWNALTCFFGGLTWRCRPPREVILESGQALRQGSLGGSQPSP